MYGDQAGEFMWILELKSLRNHDGDGDGNEKGKKAISLPYPPC